MTSYGDDKTEPYWLMKMRQAAKQRPSNRFVKIRWIELQHLLRERDALWQAANPATREGLLALWEKGDYGYLSPGELRAWKDWRGKKGNLADTLSQRSGAIDPSSPAPSALPKKA